MSWVIAGAQGSALRLTRPGASLEPDFAAAAATRVLCDTSHSCVSASQCSHDAAEASVDSLNASGPGDLSPGASNKGLPTRTRRG